MALSAFVLTASWSSQAIAATSYALMTQRLESDCAHSGGTMRLFQIGAAAQSLRPIWMLRITAARSSAEIRRGSRVVISCRQHGDEPVSTEAALGIAGWYALMSETGLRNALGTVTLYIVPMVNPDGAARLSRLTGVGADLNRDWGIFKQPETRALDRACDQIKPQLVLDLHSWTPDDPYQANSIESCPAQSAAQAVAAQQSMALQQAIITDVRSSCGQVMAPIVCSADADHSLCHRYWALDEGLVSLLVETAPASSDPRIMQERIALDEAAIQSAVRDIRLNDAQWRSVASAEHTAVAPISSLTGMAAPIDTADSATLWSATYPSTAVQPPSVLGEVQLVYVALIALYAVWQRRAVRVFILRTAGRLRGVVQPDFDLPTVYQRRETPAPRAQPTPSSLRDLPRNAASTPARRAA